MAESLGKLPFGKYKGTDLEDVPDGYLRWFVGEDNIVSQNKILCDNIRKELKYREKFDLQIKEEERE
jgi:uncharacterized protein (DUF3820 family)